MRYCREAQDAELVAICDNWEEGLRKKQSELGDGVACYTSLDDFLQHDMDAVVLANYATEHAPLAIRAMEQGFHVISEVLPCQTLKEAVELVEAVERTGKIYAYAENYCFMAAPHEMRALYRAGKRAGLRKRSDNKQIVVLSGKSDCAFAAEVDIRFVNHDNVIGV